MKWKAYHQATQRPKQPYQVPHYNEDDWWLASDVKKEVKRRAGKYISTQKIGKVAKKLGLSKDSGQGFKLYHKKVVEVIDEKNSLP